MTNREKLIESAVTKIAKKVMNEANFDETVDGQDARVAGEMVKALANVPSVRYSTNNKFLIQKYEEIADARIAIMRYVEENSNYKFAGTRNSWKLVKK